MPFNIHDALAHEFGLGIESISDSGKGQAQTRRYIVRMANGPRIAKHYADGSAEGLANVEFECLLLTWLAEAGVPVARNLPTAAGRPFAVVDHRPLILYEWADGGIEWPAPPPRARALGEGFGRLHGAADSLPWTGEVRTYDLNRLVDRPLELLEPYSHVGAFRDLVDLTEPLRCMIAEVPIRPPFFGPIHGDIHQGNCHFSEAGEVKLFDFALCGVGYRAYDLTGFLWPMRDRTIDDPGTRACCDAFLEGYEAVRPLDRTERAAIPAFVQIRSLWESGDWVDTGGGRDQPEELAKIAPYLVAQLLAAK
jgi:Ser/Thr protein kinase RdoA (MazF antagonist)